MTATSAPTWDPTPDPDLLTRVASTGDRAAFLRLCAADARAHSGEVSVNRCRALAAAQGVTFEPRAWSAFWADATGRGGPMEKVPGLWEVAAGSPSRNDGRPYPLRRWVAAQPAPA